MRFPVKFLSFGNCTYTILQSWQLFAWSHSCRLAALIAWFNQNHNTFTFSAGLCTRVWNPGKPRRRIHTMLRTQSQSTMPQDGGQKWGMPPGRTHHCLSRFQYAGQMKKLLGKAYSSQQLQKQHRAIVEQPCLYSRLSRVHPSNL